jgi:hypothetical protein
MFSINSQGIEKVAVWAGYQAALVENRMKRWATGREWAWSVRGEWLERVRDGRITNDDRERPLLLAYLIIGLFHAEVCQHSTGDRKCVLERAKQILDKEFPSLQEL